MTRRSLVSRFLFSSSDVQDWQRQQEGGMWSSFQGLGRYVKPTACECQNPSCTSISSCKSTITHKYKITNVLTVRAPAHLSSTALCCLEEEQHTHVPCTSPRKINWDWRQGSTKDVLPCMFEQGSNEAIASFGYDNPISQASYLNEAHTIFYSGAQISKGLREKIFFLTNTTSLMT